jgi:hypothetical protein
MSSPPTLENCRQKRKMDFKMNEREMHGKEALKWKKYNKREMHRNEWNKAI